MIKVLCLEGHPGPVWAWGLGAGSREETVAVSGRADADLARVVQWRMSREISEEALPGWLGGTRVKDGLELPKRLFSDTEDKALGPGPQFSIKLLASPVLISITTSF